MMPKDQFVELLRQAYSRLISQNRHQLGSVHLKLLFQEMQLLSPSLKLVEFKSQLAELHSEDYLKYQMERTSALLHSDNRLYGIDSPSGMLGYLKITKESIKK
jgi:hypothetical protein